MSANASSSFGDLLRRYRVAAGLTQEELAERAQVSPRAISDLERGLRSRPWRETIQLLADALKLTLDERTSLETAARRPAATGAPAATTIEPGAGVAGQNGAADLAVVSRTNLPEQTTSFVGRETEIAGLRNILVDPAPTSRLITLTGAGGCGKTRLALETASALIDHFPDGVWLVELARAVPPLVAPDLRSTPTYAPDFVSYVRDTAAARLFVERARLVVPNFELSEQNAPSVAEICHRLDGIPLAIELAAARLRVLPAEEIAARLSDRFRLLTGGSRTALRRQQTLRALIDWGYDALTTTEQALVRRLSVFAGGWTIEAAEAVCSDTGAISREDVFEVLSHLVDKSLVAQDEWGGAAWFWLLETIRQYLGEKLLEAGESADARSRHAAWCQTLVTRAD